MKIIALSISGPEPDPEVMARLLTEEANYAWELLKTELVRELYVRKDKPGVVAVLEAPSTEAAEKVLSELPLYRHGVIRFDLIPVGPYTNFERLFLHRKRA